MFNHDTGLRASSRLRYLPRDITLAFVLFDKITDSFQQFAECNQFRTAPNIHLHFRRVIFLIVCVHSSKTNLLWPRHQPNIFYDGHFKITDFGAIIRRQWRVSSTNLTTKINTVY